MAAFAECLLFPSSPFSAKWYFVAHPPSEVAGERRLRPGTGFRQSAGPSQYFLLVLTSVMRLPPRFVANRDRTCRNLNFCRPN
jgi:hypothetical protein